MVIEKISYKKIFPLGSFTTEHIGLEASLDVGDNPQTELEHLKVMVETLHRETVTTLDQYRGTHIVTVEEKPKISTTDAVKQGITTCTDATVLHTYSLLVKNNPQLQELYDNQLKKIQDGKRD